MTEPLPRPCWIGGKAEQGAGGELPVHHPVDGSVVAAVAVPGAEQVEAAVAAAAEAGQQMRACTAAARAAALRHVAHRLAEHAEEAAETVVAENGQPLKWAMAQVRRAAADLATAAELASGHAGWRPPAGEESPARRGVLTLRRQVPLGPVLALTPFTFPLELVARKVAATLAVGAPIVIRPAARTPLSALLLGELLAESDLPPGAFSVLPVDQEATMRLVHDGRLSVVWCTGSAITSRTVAGTAPGKKILAEPDGQAVAVVCEDYASDGDLEFAAGQIAAQIGPQAGQQPFAVQSVFVHRTLADRFVPRLVAAVRELRTGDSYDEQVDVGPMIDQSAAQRVVDWIRSAQAGGARILTGGDRSGAVIAPAVVADPAGEADLPHERPPGPLLVVSTIDAPDAVPRRVHDSGRRLRVGLFSRDLQLALHTAARLDPGELVVGGLPDHHPRTLQSAMAELSEQRLVTLPIG